MENSRVTVKKDVIEHMCIRVLTGDVEKPTHFLVVDANDYHELERKYEEVRQDYMRTLSTMNWRLVGDSAADDIVDALIRRRIGVQETYPMSGGVP